MPDAECLAEAFLAQSPACHWIVTAGYTFQSVYGDCASIFGLPGSGLVGHSVAEVLDAEAVEVWKQRFRRVLAGETLLLRDRGWNISLFPIRLEGEVRYAGGLARQTATWAKAEQELRHTVLGALKAQEFERSMVSKFLHDSVGQNLTAIGLQLDLIRMDLETLSPEICGRVTEIQKILEDLMEDVRERSYELNPSTVERAGLRSALDKLAERIHERFTGNLRLNVDPSLKLDRKIASAMYHISQEAVENALQHSGCSAIEIAVKSTRTGSFLEVRDNGRGFDPADIMGGRRGLGLLSMEQYAAQAGLDLAVTSNPGAGTMVRAVAEEAV